MQLHVLSSNAEGQDRTRIDETHQSVENEFQFLWQKLVMVFVKKKLSIQSVANDLHSLSRFLLSTLFEAISYLI